MFLCLSSGASKRYLDDIVRVLAMPLGAYITFRYRLDWLSPTVRAEVADIARHSPGVLIAYVDQTDVAREPSFVPCRMGRIVEVNPHGTTVSVGIELRDYAIADDVAAFERTAREEESGLPSRKSGKLEGFYWARLVTSPGRGVTTSTDLGMFERITEQLASHADFKDRATFYTVTDIRRVGDKSVVALRNGRLELSGDTDYEVRLYHFRPKDAKSPTGEMLKLSMISGSGTFTSNPAMALDSPYDWKAVRFKTRGAGARSDSLVLGLERWKDETAGQHEFDLPGDVEGRFGRSLLSALAIGLLLASPQIAGALSEGPAKTTATIAVALVSSVVVGLAAVFGLKKII